MSELIENAQKRKELLKHMIIQLHKGEAPEEVRKQLGVPSLRLEGDGWDSRVTSLDVIKEQFTEFFETLA